MILRLRMLRKLILEFMNQTAIFDQFFPREYIDFWIPWQPSLVIHGLKLTQITFIMIFFTIGSIYIITPVKKYEHFFSFRGHSYNRRKSVWTKYLGHCILYLNLSSYMKFSHFFLIYCICRNKTLFDRTTSLNGKKNTAI